MGKLEESLGTENARERARILLEELGKFLQNIIPHINEAMEQLLEDIEPYKSNSSPKYPTISLSPEHKYLFP